MPQAVGIVYDVDCMAPPGKTQAIIDTSQAGNPSQLIGFIQDTSVLLVLQVAMTSQIPVTVEYSGTTPVSILSANLNTYPPVMPVPPIPPKPGFRISSIEFDAVRKVWAVKTNGNPSTGYTSNPQILSLLTSALRVQWNVGYFTVNPNSGEITRAKLNMSDQ